MHEQVNLPSIVRANNIMDSDGAKNNANQDYKAQQWKINMPIVYNVNSRPTWVMTILDSTSAIRGYYYLDAADQSCLWHRLYSNQCAWCIQTSTG